MTPWSTGRAPVGGADWIILQVVGEGHQSLDAIAREAKVELSAVKTALNRLRRQGLVRLYGATKTARYVRVRRSRTFQRRKA